ncbi:LysR substrate-binding domain-containing protein [Shewanella fidelis]|uniref:LysR substrate-binding domain-containing protein n=1 Tax=Shewanella fidelis TaxID=173509 RepID=A0AAW8NSG6_9GAMM|nr:LysR substrate-binding domain-containing protein [Shewanella fidelis]MDR8526094.1 LysR substrate-binding domain-containing protein [Shewanella fidelis]MDW4813707.1 LysR substrate-binding domain-containing protein [Shewanella fidelis]MDW4817803.1 LysR substrate-binding domain-containing protein [Shewanella fidelis]MDW4821936.1 LysR substrate-binding domain-containing protein [Shewanella fidelis]MDW4826035.1 LysR substrate-binding domain-containing protein [Shewanella fidelis]
MRKLPPLRALQVFEAAARQAHFSRAAAELCITQSAVSHQVKQLEEHYGERLFKREGRQLNLTVKGTMLYQGLEQIFNELSDLSTKISGESNDQLRLAVYSSFAIKWLIPRLNDFRRLHPQIKIRLDMMTTDPELSDSVADMFITGQSGQPGFHHHVLHKERLIPVVSPSLLNPDLTANDELLRHPLLTVDEGPLGLDWDRWFIANSLPLPAEQQQHIFSHVLMAIEAAIAGQGIALASDFMVQADIERGLLVELDLPDILTGFEFQFSCKQRRLKEPAIAAFVAWLSQQK